MNCPVCYGENLLCFFEVNNVPIFQQFLLKSKEEAISVKRGDISLKLCQNCGVIFNDKFKEELIDYKLPYDATQTYSPSFSKYMKRIAKYLINKYEIKHKKVLEIGSGTGEFLLYMHKFGDNLCIGFEPSESAKNINSPHVKIINDYYSKKYNISADIIICRHVLEHIFNPREFLKSLPKLDKCIYFFEVPNVVWSLENTAFYDFYYEHCIYFSTISLSNLFKLSEFEILKIGKGFYNQYIWIEATWKKGKKNKVQIKQDKSIKKLIKNFQHKYEVFSQKWRKLIENFSKSNTVVLWGAGARAVAFLNYLKIEPPLIEYVVDINPSKHNKFIPGTGQKIVPPEFLEKISSNIYVIITNPAYYNEIEKQCKPYKAKIFSLINSL